MIVFLNSCSSIDSEPLFLVQKKIQESNIRVYAISTVGEVNVLKHLCKASRGLFMIQKSFEGPNNWISNWLYLQKKQFQSVFDVIKIGIPKEVHLEFLCEW